MVAIGRLGMRRDHFSPPFQSVSSSRSRSIDFKDMEDIQDLASSNTESTSGHSTTLSSIGHSLNMPLLPSISSSANSPSISPRRKFTPENKQSKHSRTNQSVSIEYGVPGDAINQIIPRSRFLPRSKSFDGNSSRPVNIESHGQPRLHEALSSQQTSPSPFVDVSYDSSPPHAPSTPRRSTRYHRSKKWQQQRKSLDLGYNMMQASLRRLRRSPSLWTGDRPSSFQDPHDRHLDNLRAEPQLSDQQKLDALKRARKIVQVFGSEALVDVVHGNGCIHRNSADRRDSLFTTLSGDVSIESTRRRSSFDSSFLVEIHRSSSTSSNLLKIPSDISSDVEETSSSFYPSSFRTRRRRAAKLSHFFGVNYQDISQSITQKLLPPAPQQTCSNLSDNINHPAVDVDVKVVGRRFWGLSDGGMKNADVADVIGKLRGLRVG